MSGKRYDGGKLRFDLIPPEADFAIAAVGSFGAEKYGDRNWEKGMRYSRMLGSLKRHLNKWETGITWDDESGLPHLHHVLWNAAALVAFEERGIGMEKDENGQYFDDRPSLGNPHDVRDRWTFTEETIKEKSTQYLEDRAQEKVEFGPNSLMEEWEVPSEAAPDEQEAFDDAVSASSFHALGGASTCSAPSCVCCDDPSTPDVAAEDRVWVELKTVEDKIILTVYGKNSILVHEIAPKCGSPDGAECFIAKDWAEQQLRKEFDPGYRAYLEEVLAELKVLCKKANEEFKKKEQR